MQKKKTFSIIAAIIFTAVLSIDCFSTAAKFNIYAVKYGKSDFSNRFIYYGDKSAKTTKFSWMFYYIEYDTKRILVDTGFNDPKMINTFNISDFNDPLSILQSNGISAESITDVIITHSHFDHIGNVNKFKNARIIINSDELVSLKKNNSLNYIKKFFNKNPNVTVFNDSIEIYNKFTVKKIGGHTRGSSVILFENKNIKYCFTGDEVYLRENVEKKTGTGSVYSHKNNVDFIDFLKNGNYRLFIFHDNTYSENNQRFIRVFP